MINYRTAVFYHAYDTKDGLKDCPDGIAAAAIVSQAITHYEIAVDLYPVTDRESSRKEAIRAAYESRPQPRSIYVVDYARFTDEEFEELRSLAPVVVFDHHDDQFKRLNKLSAALTLDGRWHTDRACGATIAWDELIGGKRPWWLEYVLIRDVGLDGYYQGLAPRSEALATAMSSLRHTYGTGADAIGFFYALSATTEEAFFAEHAKSAFELLEARNAAIMLYFDVWQQNPKYLVVGDQYVPFMDLIDHDHLHPHVSALGAQTAAKVPSGVVAIRSLPAHNGEQPISFRSIPSLDCRYLARFYGGGGHPQACGCAIQLPLPTVAFELRKGDQR